MSGAEEGEREVESSVVVAPAAPPLTLREKPVEVGEEAEKEAAPWRTALPAPAAPAAPAGSPEPLSGEDGPAASLGSTELGLPALCAVK
jgi:hypothetical protein